MRTIRRLGDGTEGLISGPIDLAASGPSSLASLYQDGAVCSVFYPKETLLDDSTLSADLLRLLDLYFRLVSGEARLFEQADAEDDEVGIEEQDLRRLREHKRIERNKKLAKNAKKIHGHKCMACGFDFETTYGELGRGFIEAHHLTPLSAVQGQAVSLDPRRDFAVLCSNCHRIIHLSAFVGDVHAFRAAHLAQRTA